MRTRHKDEILLEHIPGAVRWLARGYTGSFTVMRFGKPVARLIPFQYSGPGYPVNSLLKKLPKMLNDYEFGLGYPILLSYRGRVAARLEPIYEGQ